MTIVSPRHQLPDTRGDTSRDALRRLKVALSSTGLVLLVMLAFGRSLGFGFLAIDDPDNFLQNAYLRPLRAEGLKVIWTEPYWGLYTPVTSTVWASELYLTENPQTREVNPRWFHAVSLGLHAGCAVLAFFLLTRLTHHRGAAWFGAALFAVHPLQTEAVCWVSETKGLLAGLFGLMAFYEYLAFADRTQPPQSNRPWRITIGGSLHYLLATLAFLVALLSKPSAAALPLMIGATDLLVLRRQVRQGIVALLPWLLMALGLMILTSEAQGGAKVALVASPLERVLIAGDAISFYLRQLAWPFHLGPDYGRSPVNVLESRLVDVAWLVPLALLLVTLLLRPRRMWLAAAGLLVAGIAPVLGLVPFAYQDHSTVADRYLYLAMLGPALAATLLVRQFWPRSAPAAAAVVLLLATLSYRQTAVWRDDRSWAAQAIAVCPRSIAGNEVLAQITTLDGDRTRAMHIRRRAVERNPKSPLPRVYLAKALLASGHLQEAVDEFRHALTMHPKSPAVHHLLGQALLKTGRLTEAIDHLELARQTSGRNPAQDDLYDLLGRAYLSQGETDQAETSLRSAVAMNPDSAQYHNDLGRVLKQLGRLEDAAEEFRRSAALDDRGVVARNNLGAVLLAQGKTAQAIEQFRRATGVDPHDAEAQKNLCLALDRAGQLEAMLTACRRALRLDPTWLQGRYLLASRLATHPDAKIRSSVKTLRAARVLCEQTDYREPAALDILAAANAEAGRFDQAVSLATKAASQYRQSGRTAQAQAVDNRRRHYLQQKRHLSQP